MFRPLFLLGNNSEKTFYRKYSNKLSKIIALSKKNHFSSTLDKAKNDPKKTWDLIRYVLPTKTDGATSITDHFEAECNSIDPITVTNCFYNVFCSIGKLTHSNLDHRNFSNYLSNRVSTLLYLNTPSVSEIINAIYSLNVNKAVGHDNIPAFFKHIAATIISPYLQYFIDFFFKNGLFPESCTLAKVISLYKKGNKLDPITTDQFQS